jgi:hypothetical protein
MEFKKVDAVVFDLIAVGLLHSFALELDDCDCTPPQKDAIDSKASPSHVVFKYYALELT